MFDNKAICGIIFLNINGVIQKADNDALRIFNMDRNLMQEEIRKILETESVLLEKQTIVKFTTYSNFIVNIVFNDEANVIFTFLKPEGLLSIIKDLLPNICIDEMDLFFKVMDNENDVAIANSKGIIIKVSDSYERNYRVRRKDIIGQSVFELERKKIFYPSVTAIVLKEKRKVTILQKNNKGETILTTGVPIFDENRNIKYVVSFNSIDIAGLISLEDKYQKLKELMHQYNAEINELRIKNWKSEGVIAKSSSMLRVIQLVDKVSDTNANVLITGETGVGKNVIAKMIHEKSSRFSGPFIEINCGTIPENLIESELFGYERGSFTGANSRGKVGQIEMARGGTLFLDEIGELPLGMQKALLDVIQEKRISKVGGTRLIDVDFRLITATNKELKDLVSLGRFRSDLFYRLNVIFINVPPLRERKEDIIAIAMYFLTMFNIEYNKRKEFSKNLLKTFTQFDWPGNIRELKNLIERLVLISHENKIDVDSLPAEMIFTERNQQLDVKNMSLNEALEFYEKEIILQAYEKHNTSIKVGEFLGISQATASRKLRKYVTSYSNANKY